MVRGTVQLVIRSGVGQVTLCRSSTAERWCALVGADVVGQGAWRRHRAAQLVALSRTSTSWGCQKTATHPTVDGSGNCRSACGISRAQFPGCGVFLFVGNDCLIDWLCCLLTVSDGQHWLFNFGCSIARVHVSA